MEQEKKGNASVSVNRLVEDWVRAQESEWDARRKVTEALERVKNAASAVGDVLLPDDALGHEAFQMWVRVGDSSEQERLLVIRRTEDGVQLKWRPNRG